MMRPQNMVCTVVLRVTLVATIPFGAAPGSPKGARLCGLSAESC